MRTTFSFTLDQTAAVSLVFTDPAAGRRVGRKCVAQTRRNRHHPRCTRVLTAGSIHFEGHPGVNHVRFQGRTSRATKLAPGTYTLTVTATGATGLRSKSHSLKFTILKG